MACTCTKRDEYTKERKRREKQCALDFVHMNIEQYS